MPTSSGRSSAVARRRRPAAILAAVVAVVAVLAVGAVLVINQARERSRAADVPQPPSSRAAPSATGAPGPSLPVVAIGVTCATEGAAGITADYKAAFCSLLPASTNSVWSLYPGEIASPTATPGPDDEVYPPETETPVRVCTEQTGRTRLDCHADIVQGDAGRP